MNERIKQLAEQATTIEYGADRFCVIVDRVTFDKEKFAELIVRECADIAADQSAIRPEYRIKKHFGVEE